MRRLQYVQRNYFVQCGLQLHISGNYLLVFHSFSRISLMPQNSSGLWLVSGPCWCSSYCFSCTSVTEVRHINDRVAPSTSLINQPLLAKGVNAKGADVV